MKANKIFIFRLNVVPVAILLLMLTIFAPYSAPWAKHAAFAASPGAFQSDDFNRCSLNQTIWTFINPLNDGSNTMDGTRVSIHVPRGTEHHIWGTGPEDFVNDAARIMQPAANVDFDIETKFESGVSQVYQMQGVIIQQDANDLLRLEFHADDTGTRIFAGVIANGMGISESNSRIADANTTPLWMRVSRAGDVWTVYYSLDGEDWLESASFVHSLTVTSVGVFAGNTSKVSDPPGSEPEHTAIIDYFFNTASPITPEDGNPNSVTVNVSPAGSGSVTKVQNKTHYACGEEVKLYPSPNSGWKFAGWSGAVNGTANPGSLFVSGAHTVTANFVEGVDVQARLYLPITLR